MRVPGGFSSGSQRSSTSRTTFGGGMNQFQQRVFDSLERSDSFAEKNPSELGAIVGSQARQDLQAVIAEVKQHDTNQDSADRVLEGQMGKQVALAKELVHAHL